MVKDHRAKRTDLRIKGIQIVISFMIVLSQEEIVEAMRKASHLILDDEEGSENIFEAIFGKEFKEIDERLKVVAVRDKILMDRTLPDFMKQSIISLITTSQATSEDLENAYSEAISALDSQKK